VDTVSTVPRSSPSSLRRAAALGLAGLLLACGGDGAADEPEARKVAITMTDNAFSDRQMSVKAGETIEFVFTNEGEFEHEAVIGDESVQQAHEIEMSKPGAGVTKPQPGSEATPHTHTAGGGGGAGPTISLAPGDTASLTHTFEKAGIMLVGCHVPGHYADGMMLQVDVT
jgi:uncharacterized cupredoxin-like copper-binding protein